MDPEGAKDITSIVEKLKEEARASPWVPLGVPSGQHYHSFPDGLSICFTLDVLPWAQYWHLSTVRIPGGPTEEEIDFWRQAFFDEKPLMEYSGRFLGLLSRHFYWRAWECN